MKVICVGFGRTGTSSIKAALEHLLGGACYHFEELFKHPEHRRTWRKIAESGGPVDWADLFSDYVAAADFPVCAYPHELASAFPDALIVLSLREEDGWVRSWSGLWKYFAIFRLRPLRWLFGWIDDIVVVLEKIVVERAFRGAMDPASLRVAYAAHNADVQARIPPDRLLVYRVQEGWEPLCEALGVPVPTTPFPCRNAGNRPFITRTIRKMFGGRWKRLAED